MKKLTHDSAGLTHVTGVTLVEVLMSLMIMSIGMASVAVLFPISVLRSVQATQMTNSAILKYNVEAFVQMNPSLIFDPDGDGKFSEHPASVELRFRLSRRETATGGAEGARHGRRRRASGRRQVSTQRC